MRQWQEVQKVLRVQYETINICDLKEDETIPAVKKLHKPLDIKGFFEGNNFGKSEPKHVDFSKPLLNEDDLLSNPDLDVSMDNNELIIPQENDSTGDFSFFTSDNFTGTMLHQ